MTDTTTAALTIDHDPNEQPRQAQPKAEQKPTAIAEPVPDVDSSPLKKRAELVTVSDTGAKPVNLSQQIDFAQYMARASFAVPMHLRDNPGACLAVLDIATRAGLSPFMVANKTYVQNDRLAFESQLFHALLVQSGLLKGDLIATYAGDGDERTCTVYGTLKSDGIEREHTSLPLKEARPVMNERGQIKGSPLWKDKPDVQLFYDTSRDWTRMYAPTATLGIYTPEEMIEHPIDGPSRYEGAITGPTPDSSLHQRLKGVSREEGHQPGYGEAELANVAAGGRTGPKAAAKAEKQPEQLPPRKKRADRMAARRAAPKTPAAAKEETKPANQPKAPAEEETATQRRARLEAEAGAAAGNGVPKSSPEYGDYAEKWIDAPKPDSIAADSHADNLEARWDGERDLRDELFVPMKMRSELEDKLTARCRMLREP